MYVYLQFQPSLWTVGFYSPDGGWNPESNHVSSERAAERVHYLNGGDQHAVAGDAEITRGLTFVAGDIMPQMMEKSDNSDTTQRA